MQCYSHRENSDDTEVRQWRRSHVYKQDGRAAVHHQPLLTFLKFSFFDYVHMYASVCVFVHRKCQKRVKILLGWS